MLKPLKFTPFKPCELEPKGWLLKQLEIQANGLSGNLHKIWRDIKDSKWIGGNADGWERVPYWLDGVVPLAWLLRDAELMATCKTYIDGILERQQEDGWICPCEKDEREHYDIWPAFLICKVLVLYHDCTGDQRIEGAVYKALESINTHIRSHTLSQWGQFRWYECLIPLFWLYERVEEEWLLDLAFSLQSQGANYSKIYENWRFEKPHDKGIWTFSDHVVNAAMSLKADSLMSRIEENTNPDKMARHALSLLQKYHGMATGHFTGDECLSGTSPIQGSECCSVVEAMYSYEQLLTVSGNSFWGDILERTAYNALPATFSADMWVHQYDQQTNQVQCSYLPEEEIVFRTNSGEAHLFGLEPNFGCCTANFSQGWPKLALSAFMKTEGGIAITCIAPAAVTTEIDGVELCCEMKTNYPFEDGYTVLLTSKRDVTVEILLRVPAFAKSATIDGKEVPCGEYCKISQRVANTAEIKVKLSFDITVDSRPNNMVAINRGALLFSLPIGEDWVKHEFTRDGVERKFPYCDYEIFPTTKWNYGLVGNDFKVSFGEIPQLPFSQESKAVTISTKMAEVDWKLKNSVCEEKPTGRTALSEKEEKVLIPYGCTCLRVTEFPKILEN